MGEERQDSNDANHKPGTGPGRLQLSAAAALIIAYSILSHYSNEAPNAKGLAATLSLAPMLLIAGVLVWHWTRPLIGAMVAVGASALLYRYWPVIENHYEWADLVEQCAVYGLVAASFGRSLFGGRVPLCTQIAERLHGALGPAEIAYTRGATRAWTLFYALLAVSILVLYFLVTLRVWSLFVNFAAFALIAMMAIVDHAIRRRVLPARQTGGILTALRQALIG